MSPWLGWGQLWMPGSAPIGGQKPEVPSPDLGPYGESSPQEGHENGSPLSPEGASSSSYWDKLMVVFG